MEIGGGYVLFMEFRHPVEVLVGGLGTVKFCPGLYAYVGSAKRGMRGRVSRHLRREKRPWWHVDYATPHAARSWVVVIPSRESLECFIARRLLRAAKKVVKGFGASDCSCPSHLVYLGESSILRTRSADT